MLKCDNFRYLGLLLSKLVAKGKLSLNFNLEKKFSHHIGHMLE